MLFKKSTLVFIVFLFAPAFECMGKPRAAHIAAVARVRAKRARPARIKPATYIQFNPKYDAGPAPRILQIACTEAQTNVGIPAYRHLPLRLLKKGSAGAHTYALCDGKAIYITDPTITYYGWSILRNHLHHEAIHYKYRDPWNKIHSKIFIENRADTQGAYATGCYRCIGEVAAHERNFETYGDVDTVRQERELGYISSAEFGAIAKELKANKLLCPYHANPAWREPYSIRNN